jgi:hypothetical protein
MKTIHIIILFFSVGAISCTNTTSFDVGGRKLRTTGAPFVKLGMTGFKSTAGKNTIYNTELQPVYSPDIKIRVATRQHTESTREFAMEGDVSPPAGWKLLKTSGKYSTKREMTGDFDVILVDESLANRLNLEINRNVRDELRAWGENARVVTTVAYAFDQKKVDESHASGETGGTYQAASATIKVKNDSKHTTRLSNGTVFAYEISRIAWQTGRDGTPEIAALIPDYLGINRLKRPGSEWNPAKLKQ